MPLLSPDRLNAALSEMRGWHVEDGQLAKEFEFETYLAGLDFAYKTGQLAEKRDHHPDILVVWRRVKIAVSTHSEGGITEKDIGLAADVDALTVA